MTRGCDIFVRFCTSLNEWPVAVLCLGLAILQMVILDYYLVHHLGNSHLTWMALDAVNITLLIITIHQARVAIRTQRQSGGGRGKASGTMGWIAWLCLSGSVAAKTVVIFHNFSDELDEKAKTFFGPNTLKTTIALGSCTFLLLLLTQHDAPSGSEGRRYIEELTGTVVFDILDTVDILEVLFDPDERASLWNGLEEFIEAVAVLNLLLPTVPLYTLARTKFGAKKLSVRLVHGHRLLLVLAVNLPNLLIRLMLWNGMNSGVSPFTLKNILAVLLTFYDIYDQKKEKNEENLEEEKKTSGPGDTGGKVASEERMAAPGSWSTSASARLRPRSNTPPGDSDSGLSSPVSPKSFVRLSDPAEEAPPGYRPRDSRGRSDNRDRRRTYEEDRRRPPESDGSEPEKAHLRDRVGPRSDINVTSV